MQFCSRLAWTWGCRVSSAILYLAIVAIWAVFLVPAWVRRPHAVPASSEADVTAEAHGDDDLTAARPTDTENDIGTGPQADIHAGVSRRDQEYRDEVPTYPTGGGTRPGASGTDTDLTRPPAQPSQSREQMLRARRRMLTILAAMTLITWGFALLGQVKWWICVPPTGMLVLYVLLLREIAMADAELARKRAAWLAGEASQRARAARAEREASVAWPAAGPDAQPDAQIIDISGRVGDQLYDQYADAAVRAVGD